jgi:hypothetical protein
MKTVIEAYKKVIAESAEELTDNPAEVFSENLNCSIEEADMIMLQLSTLGMSEADMLKVAALAGKDEFSSSSDNIVSVCARWTQVKDSYSGLTLDDVQSFSSLMLLSYDSSSCSSPEEYEYAKLACGKLDWNMHNRCNQKIAKAIMWNMSLSVASSCAGIAYRSIRSHTLLQDAVESVTARLKAVYSYEEAVELARLADGKFTDSRDQLPMYCELLNALAEKRDLLLNGKERMHCAI